MNHSGFGSLKKVFGSIRVKILSYSVLFLIVIFNVSCRQNSRDVREIDFSKEYSDSVGGVFHERPLRVAVSAMSSPKETFYLYQELISYVAGKLNMPLEFHQRRTYMEVNNLLETGYIDFAFICSGAYIELNKDTGVDLLAVPVSNGTTLYQAYIIVPENSDAKTLNDLEGTAFAFTDLLSNTGYKYPLYRILDMGMDPDSFFSSVLFTNGHDLSISMVSKGLVEGASVHSLIFDFMLHEDPDRVKGVKIIERSKYWGIPPVVSSVRMDSDLAGKVRDILFNMHMDTKGSKILSDLMIEKFTYGDDYEYDGIRLMKTVLENRIRD